MPARPRPSVRRRRHRSGEAQEAAQVGGPECSDDLGKTRWPAAMSRSGTAGTAVVSRS